jgi:peptidoglycan/LPS O-acetylase OafA/YrhL
MAQGYIKSLDGLRGLAVLFIMSYHANVLPFTWIGIQLFFVLSGFLITGILWKQKESAAPFSQKFKNFWMRRALRIFPLYFAWLVLWGLTYIFFSFPSYYEANLPYLITYTFNFTRNIPGWQGNPLFTHLWSLCVEEQFYLFFPFLIFLLPKKWAPPLLLLFVVSAPVSRYFLFHHYLAGGMSAEGAADAVYWNLFSHLDAFALGGLIAVLSLFYKVKQPGWVLLAAFVLVLGAGFVNYEGNSRITNYLLDLGYLHNQSGNGEYVWQYTVLNLLFASAVLVLSSRQVSDRHWFKQLFSMAWLVQVGKVSYGMYIFHWAILVYVFNRYLPAQSFLKKAAVFLPYAFCVYVVAAISFRIFEQPFLRLKDRFFPDAKSKLTESPTSEGNKVSATANA